MEQRHSGVLARLLDVGGLSLTRIATRMIIVPDGEEEEDVVHAFR